MLDIALCITTAVFLFAGVVIIGSEWRDATSDSERRRIKRVMHRYAVVIVMAVAAWPIAWYLLNDGNDIGLYGLIIVLLVGLLSFAFAWGACDSRRETRTT